MSRPFVKRPQLFLLGKHQKGTAADPGPRFGSHFGDCQYQQRSLFTGTVRTTNQSYKFAQLHVGQGIPTDDQVVLFAHCEVGSFRGLPGDFHGQAAAP
jgi:hypothetical protein